MTAMERLLKSLDNLLARHVISKVEYDRLVARFFPDESTEE